MTIERRYNKTVKTQRLEDDSGNTESYQDNIDSLPCIMQALDETFGEDLDGNFGKDYLMFCGIVDVLEGDRIIDGSVEYKVVGLEKFDAGGSNDHLEVRIRLSNK